MKSMKAFMLAQAVTTGSLLLAATPAAAQVRFTGPGATGGEGNTVCQNVVLTLSDNDDTCDNGTPITGISFGDFGEISIDGTGATFKVPVNVSNTNFQASGLQAFSGTSTFNSTVSFVGPSVTVDSVSTFNSFATFEDGADFNGAITTTSVSNSGTVFTAGLSAVTAVVSNVTAGASLTALSGANISMGGNVVHNVAAGVASTDVANVGQLNAVSGNVTALQTAVNNQATQITAIQALDTSQSNQISALQAANDLVQGQLDSLFDLRTRDRRDMKQGIAAAMSMAAAPMPSEPGRIAYAVNGATFRGEYAVGGSLTYRLNMRSPTAVNVGFSYAGNKNNGVRVGVAGEF